MEGLLEDRRRRSGVADRLARAVQGQLRRAASDVGKAGARLHVLSPLATLERGYGIPLDGDGRILRRVEEFEAGAGFTLRIADGRVDCRVEGTTENEEA
jgi:exodeoxyribonuclease VII large subunit